MAAWHSSILDLLANRKTRQLLLKYCKRILTFLNGATWYLWNQLVAALHLKIFDQQERAIAE